MENSPSRNETVVRYSWLAIHNRRMKQLYKYNEVNVFNLKLARQVSAAFRTLEKTGGWPDAAASAKNQRNYRGESFTKPRRKSTVRFRSRSNE